MSWSRVFLSSAFCRSTWGTAASREDSRCDSRADARADSPALRRSELSRMALTSEALWKFCARMDMRINVVPFDRRPTLTKNSRKGRAPGALHILATLERESDASFGA